MQSFSSRIWTRVAVFISYDDNVYTTSTSNTPRAVLVVDGNTWNDLTMRKQISSTSFTLVYKSYIYNLQILKGFDIKLNTSQQATGFHNYLLFIFLDKVTTVFIIIFLVFTLFYLI